MGHSGVTLGLVRDSVARRLSELDFDEIVSEQAWSVRKVIEKFEDHSDAAEFARADEWGRGSDDAGRPGEPGRAHQT
jgi:hypothetical protein